MPAVISGSCTRASRAIAEAGEQEASHGTCTTGRWCCRRWRHRAALGLTGDTDRVATEREKGNADCGRTVRRRTGRPGALAAEKRGSPPVRTVCAGVVMLRCRSSPDAAGWTGPHVATRTAAVTEALTNAGQSTGYGGGVVVFGDVDDASGGLFVRVKDDVCGFDPGTVRGGGRDGRRASGPVGGGRRPSGVRVRPGGWGGGGGCGWAGAVTYRVVVCWRTITRPWFGDSGRPGRPVRRWWARAGDAGRRALQLIEVDPARSMVVCDLHMPGGGRSPGRAGSLGPLLRRSGEGRGVSPCRSMRRDLLVRGCLGRLRVPDQVHPGDELHRQLVRAAEGDPPFAPQLAALLLGEFRRVARASGDGHPLSDREAGGAGLVGRGYTYRQVGGGVVSSPRDGREPRAQHPAQAPPHPPGRADPLGRGSRDYLSRSRVAGLASTNTVT